MAMTAATSQATLQTALEKLNAAYLQLEQYMLTNNPGQLAATITALTAAQTAVAAALA